MYLVPISRASGEIPGPDFFDPWFHGGTVDRHFPPNDGKYRAVTTLRGLKMAAIMSLEEPRPRGMVLGERVDRLRVGEAYHFFRCKICGGYIDARDLAWIEDHEGPLPHPPQDQTQ